MKKIIDAQKWVLGMSLNKETFSKLEEAVEKLEIDPVLFSGAIRQAVTQGLLDGDTALAKQITDNVFGSDGLQQDSGTFTSPVGGEVVTWTTPSGTGNVVVTVTETDGTVTTFTMPKEDNS